MYTVDSVDEEWLSEMVRKVIKMSDAEIAELKQSFEQNRDNLEIRLQLFEYHLLKYSSWDESTRDHYDYFFEHALWIIDNFPCYSSFSSMQFSSHELKPKEFGIAREHWLVQVEGNPLDAFVVGNAGSFLCINDLETGESLLLRAQELDPTNSLWIENLIMYNYSAFSVSLQLYKKGYAMRTVEEGVKWLDLDFRGSCDHMNLSQIAECAYFLKDMESLRLCARQSKKIAAEMDCNWDIHSHFEKVLLGLIAFEQGRYKQALNYLSKTDKKIQWRGSVRTLIECLLKKGMNQQMIKFLNKCAEKKINSKKLTRKWIRQIENNEMPSLNEGGTNWPF